MENTVNESLNTQEQVIENIADKINEEVNEAPAAEETPEVVDTRDFELRVSDEELERRKKIAAIWDKITTGLLIFLMASPVLILAYIFLWFIFR